MRRSLFLISSILLCSMAAAQNPSYEKGALGHASFIAGVDLLTHFGNPCEWGVSVDYGHSFGNGLALGLGADLLFSDQTSDGFKTYMLLPFYGDVKYSFSPGKSSLFLDAKAGIVANLTNPGSGWFAGPSVGLDIGRWVVSLGIAYRNIGYRTTAYRSDEIKDPEYWREHPTEGEPIASGIAFSTGVLQFKVGYSF